MAVATYLELGLSLSLYLPVSLSSPTVTRSIKRRGELTRYLAEKRAILSPWESQLTREGVGINGKEG